MRTSSPGEVGLGDDCHLGVRKRAAAMQWGHDDAATGAGGLGTTVDDREVEPVVEQQIVQTLRRALAVGGDDDPVLLGEQVAQPFRQPARVASDRAPAGGLDDRRLGGVRCRVDRPERPARREQRVRRRVQAGERLVGVACPRRSEGLGEIVLLGEQLGRPVAHAARLDEHDLGVRREDIGEQPVVVDEPR